MLYNFLASSEKPHSVQCNKSSRERRISVANSFVLLHFWVLQGGTLLWLFGNKLKVKPTL